MLLYMRLICRSHSDSFLIFSVERLMLFVCHSFLLFSIFIPVISMAIKQIFHMHIAFWVLGQIYCFLISCTVFSNFLSPFLDSVMFSTFFKHISLSAVTFVMIFGSYNSYDGISGLFGKQSTFTLFSSPTAVHQTSSSTLFLNVFCPLIKT